MDPNQTYSDWVRALLEENAEAAREAHHALRVWLDRGGFEPVAFDNPLAKRQFTQFDSTEGRLK